MYSIIFKKDIKADLASFIKQYQGNKIFILTDENTREYCYPLIKNVLSSEHSLLTIPAGEKSKDIEYVKNIWQKLTEKGADRHSLIVNLGGGMITDLGGFVAGTFQRGIDFINIPTSLLAQVDASIGGKTGINFNNLKNQIGLFYEPKAVFISSDFLKTLPKRELISGFSEMIKHALLSGEESWQKIKNIDPDKIDFDFLFVLIQDSIDIKSRIVNSDPFERGNREALNFGHTIGHAIETYLNRRNIAVLHGEAVAIGMICELFLSNKIFTFDFHKLFEISEFLATYFKSFKIDYDDYSELFEIMKHDKKNKNDTIRFTLLRDLGQFETNQQCSREDISQSLNFYFQLQK